ncbi:MAG: hypothetical protein WC023_05920 [Rhodocyclaceae bacterium]
MLIPKPLPRWLTPVTVAFAGSLLLSLVTRLGSTINRDGMLYIGTAQAFLDGGFAAAKALFAWPFLSIAIALVSRLTGFGLETSAYLLNAIFMAGACALMVSCISRRSPELAWMTCLTVLALPGVNEYRNELLREFGCWFFVMLAWWIAGRWDERPSWLGSVAIQSALGAAALFRPEALALFPALIAWQIFSAPQGERVRRLAMIGLLPTLGGALLVSAYLGGRLTDGRIAADLGRLRVSHFDAKSAALAGALIEYARGQAGTILLFGSLALVPIKLIQKFGLLLLPLAYLFVAGEGRAVLQRHPLFAWGAIVHALVLAVFVLDLQFLAGRYTGLVLLMATPFVASGLLLLSRRFPRWRMAVVAVCISLAAANVISTGQGKGHFVDAGKWLAANVDGTTRIYIDSGRTAYHAGWSNKLVQERNRRDEIGKAATTGNHDLFVLEISRKDPPWESWLQQTGLRVVQRFELRNGDAVIIARRASEGER